MKRALKILASLVVLAIVVLALRNMIVRQVARRFLYSSTGFDLEIGDLSVWLLKPVVEIADLKLINPEDFPEPEAFVVRKIRIVYDLRSFLGDEIHLREVEVDIPKAVVIRNEDGDTNVGRLGGGREPVPAPAPAPPPPEAAGEEAPSGAPREAASPSGEGPGAAPARAEPAAKPATKPFRIDTLRIRIGTVQIYDYSRGGREPAVMTCNMNVDRTFTGVTDPKQIAPGLAAAVLENAGGQAIMEMGRIFQGNRDDLSAVQDQLEEAAEKMRHAIKGLLQPGETSGAP